MSLPSPSSPPSADLVVRYEDDAPGIYCTSHRSVFCDDVRVLIEARDDADPIREVIGRNIRPGQIAGGKFTISLPIYPELCVWEVLTYQAMYHEALGPSAELADEKIHPRHMSVQRLMLGESAADLAFAMRQNFEDDEVVAANLDTYKNQKVTIGRPMAVPRCTAQGHSLKYQKLVNETLSPKTLNEEFDTNRDQIYAMMWTFHYFQQCVFCWAKRNRSDAVRVAPDWIEDVAEGSKDWTDLVPAAEERPARVSKYDDRGVPLSASKW